MSRKIPVLKLVLISILILSVFFGCTTQMDDGDSSNNYLNAYLRHKEKFPEYTPRFISPNLIEDKVFSGNKIVVPMFSDYNPTTFLWPEREVCFAINNEPQIYTDGAIIRYFFYNGLSLIWIDIDYVNRTMKNSTSSKDFTGPSEIYSKIKDETKSFEKVELQYLSRRNGEYDTSIFEAIGSELPVYVYEDRYLTGVDRNSQGELVKTAKGESNGTITRRGVGLRSWIIVAESHEQIEECLLADALYPEGYHYATGYDRGGFDRAGYDSEGYDRHDFDKNGSNRNGDRFVGTITSEGMQGYGVLRTTEGDIVQGWFSQNHLEGAGVYYYADGSRYAGYFHNGVPSGRGVSFSGSRKRLEDRKLDSLTVLSDSVGEITAPSGDWAFLGDGAQNGLAEGLGDAVSLDSGWFITDGRFQNGNLVEGLLTTNDGTLYEGEFRNGFLVKGRVVSSNGSIYDGDLQDGKPQGSGYLINIDSTRYQGSFSEGRYSGEGKLTLANGDFFEGSFHNGLPHGMGIYKNFSEDTAERCEFYEGKRIDQVYLMRVENTRSEADALAEAERQMMVEEERQRQAAAQVRATEDARKEAENKKMLGTLGALGAGFFGAKAMGLDTGSSLQLATALAEDIHGNTGGTNLQALQSSLEANHAKTQMNMMEMKHGSSDLTHVDDYVPPSQPTEATNYNQYQNEARNQTQRRVSPQVPMNPNTAQSSGDERTLEPRTVIVEIGNLGFLMNTTLKHSESDSIAMAQKIAAEEIQLRVGYQYTTAELAADIRYDETRTKSRVRDDGTEEWVTYIKASWTGDVAVGSSKTGRAQAN